MAAGYTRKLFTEDWSSFATGPMLRDNSARGEYMAMVVPENPNGWYHNASAGPAVDRNHSRFEVRRRGGAKKLVLSERAQAWGPSVVLTRGEEHWRDFKVTAEVAVKDVLPVGIVARYRSNRDHYAAVFESGMFKLVRVLEGVFTVLDAVPMDAPSKSVALSLLVEGDRLRAQAGKVLIEAVDGCIASGGIGLWIMGPATVGKVTVTTTRTEADRIARQERASAARADRKRRGLPGMELLAELDVRGHAIGRQLRLADLTGDGRQDLIFAVPTVHRGRKWQYQKLVRLSALDLTGDVLWERGKIAPDSADVTCDLPFQAAERGDGVEVIAAFGSSIEVLDPRTGKTGRKFRSPRPPKMDPLWDEVSMYWGDGHGDDLPNLIPDSIRLCNFTGRHPYGDVLLKDRYHNAWAIDGRSFKVLWHHCCNTGHYPFAADIDGDGRDEVILGYSRVDSKGKLIGRIVLGDHPDACYTYADCYGRRHVLHPCGEAGWIDQCSGGRSAEVHLGHVQHLSLANFDGSRPDLERIIITYHGNQGIIVMMDMDNRILRKVERYASGSVCQPVNWTGDGRELIAFSPRHGDGGLWDEHFDLVVPFPGDGRPGKYMEVHDVLGLGVDQLVVWDEERLHVYGPKTISPKKRRGKAYRPVRPGPNLSNYQVNYSIPRWV